MHPESAPLPPDGSRQQLRTAAQCQERCTVEGRHVTGVAGALDEDADRQSVLKPPYAGPDRLRITALTVDREGPQPQHQQARRRPFEQLALRHEMNLARHRYPNDGRIQGAEMVASDEQPTFARHVLVTSHLKP